MRLIQGRLIIGLLLISIGVADIAFEPTYRFLFGKASYSTEAAFRIPGTTLELVLDRRCIHLFLSEYERTLVLRDKDGDIVRLAVATDTGGHSRMKVYRVSTSQFYLQGDLDFDRYLLDVSKPLVAREIAAARPPQAQLIGSFDQDEKGWRFILQDEEEL